jgi:hypothetical protein
MKALVFIAICHECRNLRPFFWEPVIKLEKLGVLFVGPGFDLSFGELVVLLANFHAHLAAVLRDDWDHKFSLHFFYKINIIGLYYWNI